MHMYLFCILGRANINANYCFCDIKSFFAHIFGYSRSAILAKKVNLSKLDETLRFEHAANVRRIYIKPLHFLTSVMLQDILLKVTSFVMVTIATVYIEVSVEG